MPGRPRTMLKRICELSDRAEQLERDLFAAAPRAYREHELVTASKLREDAWNRQVADLLDRDCIAARWVMALRQAISFNTEVGILAVELEAKAERNGVKLDPAPEVAAGDG